jgi:hypothetical protein
MDTVFANCSDDYEIYPLTTAEIAAAHGPMQLIRTSLSTVQLLIKDWRSNSLRTLYVCAKMVS